MSKQQGTISVTGKGRILSPATSFGLRITVKAKRNTPSEVLDNVGTRQRAVLEALRTVLTDDEITARGASVSENFRYAADKDNKESRYEAQAEIWVDSDKLEAISEITRLSLEAGADELAAPQFSVEDPALDYRDALQLAAEAARERATLIAEALGIELGRIVKIQDGSSGWDGDLDMEVFASPSRRRSLRSGVGATATPPEIVTSSIGTTAEVSITFEIEQ